MAGRKINVGYLGHGLFYGGATMSLLLLVKSFNDADYCKHLFVTSCRAEDMKTDFLKHCKDMTLVNLSQIHNNQCGHTPIFRFILNKYKSSGAFIAIINELNLDILHVNTSVFPQILKQIKTKTNVKIVTHVRELIPKYGFGIVQKYMETQIREYSDAIIAISDNEAKAFTSHPNLHVLPNPFDFSAIEAVNTNFREKNEIAEDCVLVGMLGQFHKFKGHLDFLRALRIILDAKEGKRPFKFVIIGVYPKTPAWKLIAKKILLREDYGSTVFKFIADNDLERHLELVPYSYSVFETIKAMDIIVRPSVCGDPWGRDIIESMSLGKPIIATGTSEFLVEDGNTGYLVPPQNPRAMADRIVDLIDSPEKVAEFGARGYAKVRGMCDLNAYGAKIKNIYESLIME